MNKVTESPQMKIRLSQALKTLIEQAAKSNNRTMNSEIVSRLEATFSGELIFQLSDKINDLGRNSALTPEQREEVLELIRQELGKRLPP